MLIDMAASLAADARRRRGRWPPRSCDVRDGQAASNAALGGSGDPLDIELVGKYVGVVFWEQSGFPFNG